MEKIPFSFLQRGSNAYVIPGLLVSKTDEQNARGQEEGGNESGRLLCFTGQKGTGCTMSITIISANPAAVPWTRSAAQDLDRHTTPALEIFRHCKSRPEIYLCSSASPDSFNSIQVTIFFRQEHLCTVPKLCQERKVSFK